jgi:hypothetical protein
MTNDIRVLTRERFLRMKDADSLAPKANRHERRAAQRHAKLLEATRIKVVGNRADSSEDKKGQTDTLRSELERVNAPAGFARTRAGLLISAVLAAELFAAGCGTAVTDDDYDADAVADVQPDAEDVVDAPDQPDVLEGTEDAGPETDADVTDIPDLTEDTEAIEDADVSDIPDITDETEALEDADAPEEAGGCVEVPLPDEIASVTGPEPFCGATQTTTTTTNVTERTGPECETTGRTSVMASKAISLSSRLSTAGLGCAKGTDIHALNGDMIIVEQQPAQVEIARKIAKGVISGGDSLGGTPGEYTVTLRELDSEYTRFEVYDTAGAYQGDIYVYYTGSDDLVVLPGFPSRAVIVYNPNLMWMTVNAAIIEVPTTIMVNGSIQIWTAGDRGEYTFSTDVVGSEFSGERWTRVAP